MKLICKFMINRKLINCWTNELHMLVNAMTAYGSVVQKNNSISNFKNSDTLRRSKMHVKKSVLYISLIKTFTNLWDRKWVCNVDKGTTSYEEATIKMHYKNELCEQQVNGHGSG